MSFKCPKCGGSTWGSSFEGVVKVIRHCHGHIPPVIGEERSYAISCRFTWPEEDDEKYGVHKPADSSAKEALYNKEVSVTKRDK